MMRGRPKMPCLVWQRVTISKKIKFMKENYLIMVYLFTTFLPLFTNIKHRELKLVVYKATQRTINS